MPKPKTKVKRYHAPKRRAGAKPFDVVAYMFKADLFHYGAIVPVLVNQGAPGVYLDEKLYPHAEMALDAIAKERGIDRYDENTFDSDEFPKVVFRDQMEDYFDLVVASFPNGREVRKSWGEMKHEIPV